MSWFRPCVRPMFRYFVILNRRPLAPSALPEFIATMDVSDSRSTMPDSSLVRLVLRCHPLGRRCTGSPWLPCSLNVRLELVSDPGVFERTCHDARPNIACGRREKPSALPNYRIFEAQSIQGQPHLLPLVLACSPGYASTDRLPDPPQAWIPSPRLRATWRASHSLRT